MATVQIPVRMFERFLNATKHTVFRDGERPVSIGNHTLISNRSVGLANYNLWTITHGREGEIIDTERFVKQTINVNRIVIQELGNFTLDDIYADGYESQLEALSDLQQDDPTLSLNSPVTLVRFTLVLP